MKKVFLICSSAFVSNLLWENLHSFLYIQYMHGSITEFVLIRAALTDAAMITIITLPFVFLPAAKKQSWAIVAIGFVLAVGIERWALDSGRWAYNTYMPIIPLLSVGLTPAIQLGVLGYLSFKLEEKVASM